MEAAGSRALCSSESVPAWMMLIQRRAAGGALPNEKQLDRAGGGPASEGVCVRRIPKLKHTKTELRTGWEGGTERRTKNSFILVTHTLTETRTHNETVLEHILIRRTRTKMSREVMRFIKVVQ